MCSTRHATLFSRLLEVHTSDLSGFSVALVGRRPILRITVALRFVILATLVIGLPALGRTQGRVASADPVVTDPPRDVSAPATSVFMRIPVRGAKINGILLVATGSAPHPTVLLLHGNPGYGRLYDLGESFRRAGYNALVFDYRGAWGSEGTFTLGGSLDDAAAALAWLKEPATLKNGRVDPNRIYAIGHSFGGFVGVRLAARTHDLKGLAYLSGWDIVNDTAGWIAKPSKGDLDSMQADAEKYGTTGRTLIKEIADHRQDYALTTLAVSIADRPVLMTWAEADDACPPDRNHAPLRDALQRAGAAKLEIRSFATDHSYSDARIGLARTVVQWLDRIGAAR